MNLETTSTPRRWSGGRIAAIFASGVIALLSLGVLTAGGLLLLADSEKDSQGYIATGTDSFGTSTHALVSDNLDLHFDGPESIIDDGILGKIRVRAESNDGKPAFVGVARTDDVERYLRRSSHAVVTDVDYSPFRAEYSTRPGNRTPGRPADQRIWAASAQGEGRQELVWDVEDGDWSVVVMNADGSPGVDADISAGARVAWLDEAGWISLGSGVLLLAIAGGLLFLGVRRPRGGAPLGSNEQAQVTAA
jgi:hypothetical protein